MQIKDPESFFFLLGAIYRHYPCISMYHQKACVFIDDKYDRKQYLRLIDSLKSNKLNYHIIFGSYNEVIYIDSNDLYTLLFKERFNTFMYPSILKDYNSEKNITSFLDGLLNGKYYDKRTDKIKFNLNNEIYYIKH